MTTTAIDPVADIRRALDAGDPAMARARADAALAAEPQNLRYHLVMGEVLIAEGRKSEACTHLEAASERWPGNVWVRRARIDACIAAGDIDTAHRLYDQATFEGLTETHKTTLARRLAAADRRRPEAVAVLSQRVEAAPDDAALWRELASTYIAHKRIEEALEAFSRSEALEPLPAWAANTRLAALVGARRLAHTYPLADEAVIDALVDGLVRFPRDPLFMRHLHRLPIPRDTALRLYREARQRLADPGHGFLAFETAKAAWQAGDIATARQSLAALDPESRWHAIAAPLAAVLETVPGATWQRSRLTDDPSEEVQVVRSAGATTTILVFATLTGNFMMLPLAALDALLAEIPANIVYLRDTVRMTGLKGLVSLGGSIDATTAGIARILAELGTRETLVLGASVSGLAAIRFGARLGVPRVLTFGGLASIDPDAASSQPNLQRTLRTAKSRIVDPVDERVRDAAAELAAAPDMRVDMVVGADCAFDLAHAARMESLDQVHIHHESDVDHHYVALSLIARDRFLPAVRGHILR